MWFFWALTKLFSWCDLPAIVHRYLQTRTTHSLVSSCCSHLTAKVTLWFMPQPPPLLSIALSQSSFSKLTAFFLRVESSTARFRLHRKFVRLWARSVSRFTWAPKGLYIYSALKPISGPVCTASDSCINYVLWIIEYAAVWSSSGRRRVFRLVTPGCFLCTSPFRKSTCVCWLAAALIPCTDKI